MLNQTTKIVIYCRFADDYEKGFSTKPCLQMMDPQRGAKELFFYLYTVENSLFGGCISTFDIKKRYYYN